MNVTAELKRPRSAHGETRPWRDEVRATLTLAWPIVVTNLAQMAIGTTEVVLLGWYSPEAMAAGVLGVNLFYAFMMIGIGIATGCSPMLAQPIGRKHRVVRDLRRTVRQGFWLTPAKSASQRTSKRSCRTVRPRRDDRRNRSSGRTARTCGWTK